MRLDLACLLLRELTYLSNNIKGVSPNKMHHIKTGIQAREIMDKNFPIIDSSISLLKCVKKMNKKHEACLVVKKGNFYGVLGHDDLLRGFMYGRDREATIDNIKIKKNFAIVNPNSDIYKTLLLMKENNIDFIVVKNKKNFLGLITKKEITDIEPILFDNIKITTKELLI